MSLPNKTMEQYVLLITQNTGRHCGWTTSRHYGGLTLVQHWNDMDKESIWDEHSIISYSLKYGTCFMGSSIIKSQGRHVAPAHRLHQHVLHRTHLLCQ